MSGIRATLALVLLTVALGCSDAGPTQPPNVVVFITDDQGYGDVGAFGATDIPTPGFDRFAAEGLRLTSFYSAPTCTPNGWLRTPRSLLSRRSTRRCCREPHAELAARSN